MIWIFGDSFSERFSDFIEPCNVIDYVKWKGYSPKMYYDYLSNELKDEVNNQSLGGMCNDYIFFKFIENYDLIKENDTIIFGWTEISRFSIPHNDIWYSSIFNGNPLSTKTIEEIQVARTHQLQKRRQFDIINFIDKILFKNKVVHWTWVNDLENRLSIEKETNGLIIDYHYSEEGQYNLYLKIKEGLSKSSKTKIGLWN